MENDAYTESEQLHSVIKTHKHRTKSLKGYQIRCEWYVLVNNEKKHSLEFEQSSCFHVIRSNFKF
jgi:hypothetical protein